MGQADIRESLAVIAVQVSGDEVDAGPDVPDLQSLHERIAIQPATLAINAQNEQGPCMVLGMAGQGQAAQGLQPAVRGNGWRARGTLH